MLDREDGHSVFPGRGKLSGSGCSTVPAKEQAGPLQQTKPKSYGVPYLQILIAALLCLSGACCGALGTFLLLGERID